MKILMLLTALSMGLAAGGCSLAMRSKGIEATDLSAVVVGADRETVEDVLGSPMVNVETAAGRIDTYRYNVGSAPETASVPSGGWSGGGGAHAGYALALFAMGYVAAQPFLMLNYYEEQKGLLAITYGPDDVVANVGTEGHSIVAGWVGTTRDQVESAYGEPPASENTDEGTIYTYRYAAYPELNVFYGPDYVVTRAQTFAQTIEEMDRRNEEESRRQAKQISARAEYLMSKAEQGDVEAQFELYVRSGTVKEGWEWLCRSAHGGHAQAQFATGAIYKLGSGRKAMDPVKAYRWYGLAAGNGQPYAKFETDALAETMTPAQIAEAERLAAEWKPDPDSCEAEGEAASK